MAEGDLVMVHGRYVGWGPKQPRGSTWEKHARLEAGLIDPESAIQPALTAEHHREGLSFWQSSRSGGRLQFAGGISFSPFRIELFLRGVTRGVTLRDL